MARLGESAVGRKRQVAIYSGQKQLKKRKPLRRYKGTGGGWGNRDPRGEEWMTQEKGPARTIRSGSSLAKTEGKGSK